MSKPADRLEETRTALEAFLRDMRHGWLAMARRKRFAVTVVATITLGIAANTSIFALVNAALLRPLPYPKPDRLVALREVRSDSTQFAGRTSPARLEDWRALTRTLETIAGAYMDTFTNATSEMPTRLSGAVVSPGFFETFQTAPLRGRGFAADEEQAGGPLAAVISERLWRQLRLDATSSLPQIRLGEGSYMVVGVMPGTFVFPSPATDVWIPKRASAQLLRVRQARNYDVIGRLKDGVTAEQAAAELSLIQRQLGERHPRTDAALIVSAQPLKALVIGPGQDHLWLVFGAGLLILLVTCANVGCLLLAQAPARTGEMQTRAALGATAANIVRQLAAEASAYAIAGGILGVSAAALCLPVLRNQLSTTPRIGELRFDVAVAAFVSIQVIVATFLFALAPAVRLWWCGRQPALAHSGRAVAGGGRTLRALVIAQLSVATVLLIAAGLLAQSFVRLRNVPLGLSPERVLTFRVSASFSDGDPADIALRQMRVLSAVAQVPGIQRIAASPDMPGLYRAAPDEFSITDEGVPGAAHRFALVRPVTSDYFDALGIRLLAGETCRLDPAAQTPTAIVNRKFVEMYLGRLRPIGRSLVFVQRPNNPPLFIGGVVENVREEGYGREFEPIIYTCAMLRFWPDPVYLARTAAEPAQLAPAVRAAVNGVEPSRAVYEVVPMTDVLAGTLTTPRFQASLIGLFAAIAILLAAVGLYGVLSYTVARRTREIGIRLALGAEPVRVTRDVVLSALASAAAGIAAGMVMALLFAPVMSRVLFGVSTFDVPTYLVVGGSVAVVAAIAAVVPAWRAGSLQPTEALRLE